MKLKKLLNQINYSLLKGSEDIDVCDLSYDSRKIDINYAFVAIVGNNVDGHDYIEEAIFNGANVLIVSKKIEVSSDVTIVKVEDTSKILSRLSMNLFDNPHEKMTTIAITGTKGKTTTSFMIKKIIEETGNKCGVIGTTGIYIGDKYYPSKNTTPLSYDTLSYMNEMVQDNIKYVVMEVSSQSLKYDRVNDIIFDYGVFTNLTKDHIGLFEHNDMDDYIESKSRLFKQCRYGILNVDDEYYVDMIDNSVCSINTYGYNELADLKVRSMNLYKDGVLLGIDLELDGILKHKFKISTPGKFSAYNAMSAILTCYLMGIDIECISRALNDFCVRGRVEPVNISNTCVLYIDYAHNGSSASSILSTILEYAPKRIVTIFGSGGNRSRDRRYEMGEVVGRYSDFCIITEDNNRFEEFEDIAKDILIGMKKTNCEYIIIPDRKDAIKYAIENSQDGDVIMLLGKGHEDYKEIKGIRYSFDERVVIREILAEIKE